MDMQSRLGSTHRWSIVVFAFLLLVAAPSFSAAPLPSAGAVPWANQATISNATDSPGQAVVADFDGDGDLDILSKSYYSRTYLHDNVYGDGSAWGLRGALPTTRRPYEMRVADMDCDGDLDIVCAYGGGFGLAWYSNEGDAESWTTHTLPVTEAVGSAFDLAVVDVDRNGRPDILVADHYNDNIWYFSNDGSWTQQRVATLDGVYSVDAADLDGDGDVDIVAGNMPSSTLVPSQVVLYDNDGSSSVWTPYVVASGSYIYRTRFAEMEQDGDMDLVVLTMDSVTTTRLRIYTSDSSGLTTSTYISVPVAPFGNEIALGDVNGDTYTDIAMRGGTGVPAYWCENPGDLTREWSRHDIGGVDDDIDGLCVADLDGDGDSDLVTWHDTMNQIGWYENRTTHRNAIFHSALRRQAGGPLLGAASSMAVSDLRRHGYPDAIVTDQDTGFTHVYEGVDSSVMMTTSTVSTSGGDRPGGATDIAVGEILRTGYPGMVVASQADESIYWYGNYGPGNSYVLGTASDAAPAVDSVAVADMDGDGDMDIVGTRHVSIADSRRYAIWLENDGNPLDDSGNWAMSIIPNYHAGPAYVAAGDLDGDGDADVVVSFEGDDLIMWYESSGGLSPSFTARAIDSATIRGPRRVALGDIDGDGDLDVAVCTGYNESFTDYGCVYYYENDGTPSDGGWVQRTVDASAPQARDIGLADVDGDGDMDILASFRGKAGLLTQAKVAWYDNQRGTPPSFVEMPVLSSLGSMPPIYSCFSTCDADRDGDTDLFIASNTGEVIYCANGGGQATLDVSGVAPTTLSCASSATFLNVEAQHNGRSGDGDLEMARMVLEFRDASDVVLSEAALRALVREVRIYADANDNDAYDDGVDSEVFSTTTLAVDVADGRLTCLFTDNDPDVALSYGQAAMFFVRLELTSDASAQSPNQFAVYRVVGDGGEVRDAAANTSATLEYAGEIGSGLCEATGVAETPTPTATPTPSPSPTPTPTRTTPPTTLLTDEQEVSVTTTGHFYCYIHDFGTGGMLGQLDSVADVSVSYTLLPARWAGAYLYDYDAAGWVYALYAYRE